jgi:hypothetical protein
VGSKPHPLPGLKTSSNQLKLKVCNRVPHSWNLIWNLENRSMREKLKHLKPHFQFLRENKIKSLKFNSGDLQGSTRPLMNLPTNQGL